MPTSCRHAATHAGSLQVDCGASLLAAVGGKDVDRLPTASTCSNTLKASACEQQTTTCVWRAVRDACCLLSAAYDVNRHPARPLIFSSLPALTRRSCPTSGAPPRCERSCCTPSRAGQGSSCREAACSPTSIVMAMENDEARWQTAIHVGCKS